MSAAELSAGLFAVGAPATWRASERQLLLAVLLDAVQLYRRGRHATNRDARRLFEETRAWFASTERTTLFSFEVVCEALDLDPDYVRRMLSPRSARRRRDGLPASRAAH